jgi:hypothetical protein
LWLFLLDPQFRYLLFSSHLKARSYLFSEENTGLVFLSFGQIF